MGRAAGVHREERNQAHQRILRRPLLRTLPDSAQRRQDSISRTGRRGQNKVRNGAAPKYAVPHGCCTGPLFEYEIYHTLVWRYLEALRDFVPRRLSARRSRRGCLNVCFATFWALENVLNALRPSLQALLIICCCRWFMIPCMTLKLVPEHEGKETRSYGRMEKGEHGFCGRGGHQAGDRIRSGVRLRRPGDRYHFVSLCVVRQMLAFRAPGND